MLNIPAKLGKLDEPIRVGVIGAGLFGTKLMDQIEVVDGMTTSVVADINEQAGRSAFEEAGVPDDAVRTADDPAEIEAVLDDGDRALTTDANALIRSDVDVVVESTGVPNVGAKNAYEAIRHGKHVVMVTVEAETVVGPILAETAEKHGVTYSMVYGDQPSVIVELYDWAQTVGLEVVAAGKGNPYVEEYQYGTPDDIFDRFGFSEEYVEESELNPYMYNSFLDGTKPAVEMCAVANATGLKPDVPGMHLPSAEIPEIQEVLRPKEDGGILENTGVVDTVSSLYPDESEVDDDISFGVFIVTRAQNVDVQQYLDQMGGSGMYVANEGKYQLFYRPYHLPGVEATVSIANAALRNEPTGAPRDHVAEVVGRAKRTLEPGETLDGGGGYTVYGSLEDAETAKEQDHVPFELLDDADVTATIERDEVVTFDQVDLDEDTFIYKLRQVQDELYGN
ncbi:flagellar biosynthesis protein FlgA [Halorubrum sp. CBA1125]|uniref:NAD(P)H-dependent oxidoreductase n=1 Tax=Halorubrum sp. CBA1125 TaxID=2668072 RepID=UPI0012E7E254|nr:flagellar biosynthesis protein FlgA [Halorubrum sp. CBA1125]MUW13381.1 flagellar biosynthesis protein FlgA [Halorubrum sp. CBA1125]